VTYHITCHFYQLLYTLSLFCGGKRRTSLDTEDYWFGLYKETATPEGTTAWYDGNPSNYTNWDTGNGEPNEFTTCVRYTRTGFKDRPCDQNFYYTCKKPAGNVYHFYAN